MLFEFTIGMQKIDFASVKINVRQAVRAVIIKNGKILMIHSVKGDYKFPGGGIKINESHEDALAREVREETGYVIKRIINKIGLVTERNIDAYHENYIFEMHSYYYLCEVAVNQGKQELDAYEAELGFVPQWTDIDFAICNNDSLLEKGKSDISRWVKRETAVLRELKKTDLL